MVLCLKISSADKQTRATAKQTAQEAEDSQEVDASKKDEDYKTTDGKVKIYEKYPLTAEAIIETE